MAITGIHASFNSPAAEELRAFIRDKLGLRGTDIGGGFIIFDSPTAEIACDRADVATQSISFSSDDLDATMTELRSRGVEFTTEVTDEIWGRWTRFRVPGGDEVRLYEPKYTLAK